MDDNEKQAIIELAQVVRRIGDEQENMVRLLGRIFELIDTFGAHAAASGNALKMHSEEFEKLFKARGETVRFASGLGAQYAEIMKAQASRIAALEAEVFGDRGPPSARSTAIN